MQPFPTLCASPMRDTSTRPPRRAALAFIFAVVLLDVIALGIVIPVLPKLVEGMVGRPRAGPRSSASSAPSGR